MQRSSSPHARHRRGGPSIGARSTTTAYLRRRLGLSILELIIVFVLLGVLAAIAVPTYLSVIRSSENHAALITLENFTTDAWANAKATGETYLTQTAIDAAAKDVTAYATGTGSLAAGMHGIRLVTTSKRYGTAATGIGKLHPTVMWSAMVSKAADCVYVEANAGSVLLAKVGYPPGVTPPKTCKVPTTAVPVPGGGGGAGTPAVRALSATTAIPPDPPTTLVATPTSRSCNGNGITPSGHTTASAYVRALSAPSVSSSLLAWYPMGSFPKGPTTTAASALTGKTQNNGTFSHTGPAGVQTSGEAGPFGITGTPSADFPSGADFYAHTATTAPTSAVTVSAWLGVSTQTDFTIANDFTPSSQSFTGSPTYLLTDNAAGHELAASVTTSSGTSAPTTYSLTVPYATLPGTTANELFWHDVSMTYNGTSLILYVDGQQVGSTPASGTLVDTSSALRLGAKNAGVNTSHEYADVWVSNISVAASAFSPTLEASLFAAGATGPVVKYHVIGEGTETLTPSSKTGRQQTGDYLATAGAGSYDAPALSLTTSCLSSSGTSYPLATEPITWTEATSAGQGFVVATATQRTTLSSAPTKTAPTYTDYTNTTGVAKAWAVAAPASATWKARVVKDAAGNSAGIYEITAGKKTVSLAAQIATTSTHSCAVMPTAHAWCWGSGQFGELGNNSFATSDVPVEVKTSSGTGVLSTVTQVSAGGWATCAIVATGHVWCWGNDNNGQLGNGRTTTTSERPVEVKTSSGTGVLSTVTQVSAGDGTTCAVTTDHNVWCWGIGYGAVSAEVETSTGAAPLGTVTQVSAGGTSQCAVTAARNVWCWGENTTGQLGNGTTTKSALPVEVKTSSGTGVLSTVTQVSVGQYSTCAVTIAHNVWCWGENSRGELGNGTRTTSDRPVEVTTSSGTGALSTVIQVSAGQYSTCAVTIAHTAWCWGENTKGQLGNGTTTTTSDRPVEVTTSSGTGALSTVIQAPTGGDVTCTFTSDNSAWCWGTNRKGQLGNGTTTNSDRPVEVKNL